MSVGRGAEGIGTSIEVFLLLFFGGCKYVCATLDSQCWSKLNAEFSLFIFSNLLFFFFFVGKKPGQIPHSLQLCGSYLWVVQFSLSDRRCLFSLTDLFVASQYDQL